MAKNSVFKKNWKKDVKEVAIRSGIRGAATIGTAWLANETIPKVLKLGETNPANRERYNKFGGALFWLLGTLGEATLQNESLVPVAQGMSSYGALHLAGNNFLKNHKQSLGLGEIAATDSEITDWEVLRANMGAVDPLEDVNRTLDTALARAITGVDEDTYMETRPSISPAVAAGGGAVAVIDPGTNINGVEDEFDKIP